MKIENFRDLGGIVTQDGKKIKPNKIIRSGRLSDITDSCKQTLKNDYHLKTVVDFRRPTELKNTPNQPIDGVNFVNLDLMDNLVHSDHPDPLTEAAATAHLAEFYTYILTSSGKLTDFMKLLATHEEGAVLFHCHHGKDRTGLGAAVFLKALNVSDEVIFDDYLKTLEARKADNEAYLNELRAEGYDETYLAGMNVLINVRKEYLEYVFDTIEKKYGGFDNYLKNELQLTEADLTNLRAIYLED